MSIRRQELWFNTNHLPFIDFVLDGILHFYYAFGHYPASISANWQDVADEHIRLHLPFSEDLIVHEDLPQEIPVTISQGLLPGHIMLWDEKEKK
jgi:hypothetical protein